MASGPLSVPLPDSLRRKLAKHAKARHLKLATTARTLIAERIAEIEDKPSAAEIWQRKMAFEALDHLEKHGPSKVSQREFEGYFEAALARARTKKKK